MRVYSKALTGEDRPPRRRNRSGAKGVLCHMMLLAESVDRFWMFVFIVCLFLFMVTLSHTTCVKPSFFGVRIIIILYLLFAKSAIITSTFTKQVRCFRRFGGRILFCRMSLWQFGPESGTSRMTGVCIYKIVGCTPPPFQR